MGRFHWEEKKMKKILNLLLAVMLCISLSACSANSGGSSGNESSEDEKTTYTVGIIQLVQHEALDAATQGFIDALKEKLGDAVEITSQNGSGDYNSCSTIVNQYVSDKVDLIMANATPALQAASSATNSIPIVGVSISHYGTALGIDPWTGVTGKNVTGVSDLAPLDEQAQQIKEIFPEAKKVGILYCSSEANSSYQATEIAKTLDQLNLEHEDFTFSDSNDISAVTESACEYADVIYIPTDNTAATYAETIHNVAYVKEVPIVAGEEGIARACGTVTITLDYYTIGYQSGLMAYDILVNGADPATMEIQFADEFVKKYNKEICEKYGLAIPSDYVALD